MATRGSIGLVFGTNGGRRDNVKVLSSPPPNALLDILPILLALVILTP